jgi:hypothetical protein
MNEKEYRLAMKRLKAAHLANFLIEKPDFPPHAIPAPKLSAKDTNGLTACVASWINWSGGAAFRINSQGQYDQKIGAFRKSGSTTGVSDIVAVVGGRFVALEIKFGRDKQSEVQKKFELRVIESGGIYQVISSLPGFFAWWDGLF